MAGIPSASTRCVEPSWRQLTETGAGACSRRSVAVSTLPGGRLMLVPESRAGATGRRASAMPTQGWSASDRAPSSRSTLGVGSHVIQMSPSHSGPRAGAGTKGIVRLAAAARACTAHSSTAPSYGSSWRVKPGPSCETDAQPGRCGSPRGAAARLPPWRPIASVEAARIRQGARGDERRARHLRARRLERR
jgi:hypothetical protein